MVTYAEYLAKGMNEIDEGTFNKIESRCVDLLSSMCSTRWDVENETCKKAVIYQIDFVLAKGGLTSWIGGSEGTVTSRSYSIGGESESVGYSHNNSKVQSFKYNNMEVAPLAIALLTNAGIYKAISGVRVW